MKNAGLKFVDCSETVNMARYAHQPWPQLRQNEIPNFFKKWDLDIKYHRAKMEKAENAIKNLKTPKIQHIVWFCLRQCWLTGFDVKCLSCLYLDKAP